MNNLLYCPLRPAEKLDYNVASASKNFYIQKSNTEIKRKSFSRIGTKLWNEIPAII